VGYCGGKAKNPSYSDLKDHTESIEIDYDPSVLPIDDLLAAFWEAHSPTSRAYSIQYRAALFFSTPEEEALYTKSKREVEKKLGVTVHTAVTPYTNFSLAEDYHQKYYLRGKQALFSKLGYSDEEIINNPLACHLNALVSGNCSRDRALEIIEEVKALGNTGLTEVASKFVNGSRQMSCF